MPAAAVVSIVLGVVLALAVAAYLLRVVLILRAVNDSLGKITFGVRAIAHRTAPLGELLAPTRDDLVDVAEALEGVAATLSQDQPAA